MAANLTRDEARTRAELIKVNAYRVLLDLTGGDTTFRSVSRIEFDCALDGAGTFVNLAAPGLHGVTLNGSPVSPDAFDGERITIGGLRGGRNDAVSRRSDKPRCRKPRRLLASSKRMRRRSA